MDGKRKSIFGKNIYPSGSLNYYFSTKQSCCGFTLIELLITFSLIGILLMVSFAFYLSCLKVSQGSLSRVDSNQQVRIATEKVVRELRYASNFTIYDNGGEIRFKAPHDNNRTLRFRLIGEELVYESYPTGSAGYFHNKIAMQIKCLLFEAAGENLISITIEAGDNDDHFQVKTGVSPRNILLSPD